MKILLKSMLLVSLLLGSSCEKRKTASGEKEGAGIVSREKVEEEVVVEDLGFASRVPVDSDFFFAAYYDGGELMTDGMKWGLKSGILLEGQIEPKKDLKDVEKEFQEAAGYLGSEVFVFSGPGVAGKLKMVGESYRELSAAWAGFAIGAMLDAVAKDGKEPDFTKLAEGFSDDFLERWLSVVEKESKLLVPSVVAGWHPDEAKRGECEEAVAKRLDEFFKEKEGAAPVRFESYGAEMVGYEVKGTEVFGDMVEEGRKELAKKAEGMTYGGGLSAERLGDFLTALEDVKFTVATGVVDGRVLVYFGDGEEGFKLAGKPEESLAANDDLRWMASPEGKRLMAAGYFSERMVGCVLPWLDTSKYWESVAGAVRAPVVEQRLMRELLMGLAGTAKDLAQRDISAWSAALYSGNGWSLQTRGGIVDPSIDFETPLKFTKAVDAMNPAFRGHWIQKRDWNDLSWKKTEYMGFIIEAVGKEVVAAFESEMKLIPGGDGFVERLAMMGHGLNNAYRDEFRNGIGDEVAVFGDFLGEVPPVPGISEETIRDFTVPRFVYARPVMDRVMVSKAGDSTVDVWKETIAYANSLGDGGIPLILPQAIESNDLVTWYAPLPFIGGDFVPGITLNDRTWMVGTSRSLAGGFAKEVESESGSGETGVMIEVDFDSLGEWLRDAYEKGKEDAEAAAAEDVDPEDIEQMKKSADGIFEALSKLQSLKYRHWLEDGKPRTSLDIAIDGE